ncbi:hypothetical protein B0H13DRAFT_2323148 [Mycena leptocephala]|nr:hypothetical protein B0H13DRAFT_2323148 [Mycena leptocephala]
MTLMAATQRFPFSVIWAAFEEQPASHHRRLLFLGRMSVSPPSSGLPIRHRVLRCGI